MTDRHSTRTWLRETCARDRPQERQNQRQGTVSRVALRPGRHGWPDRLTQTPRASQIILAFEVLLTICIFSIKFALLLFYRHTFPIRKFQLAVYGAMVLNVTMAVAISLGYLLQCRPISYMWDRSIKGSCFDIRLYLRITIILNLFTDFTVLLMPLPLVWRLQMTVGRKISISVMFLLGTMYAGRSILLGIAVPCRKLTTRF